ncbi:MAG TPA: hypothetical protein VG815_20545, partial [Chloroflexota bacterium]|nr:hypothetical protein [Chloroflexota bacterium]
RATVMSQGNNSEAQSPGGNTEKEAAGHGSRVTSHGAAGRGEQHRGTKSRRGGLTWPVRSNYSMRRVDTRLLIAGGEGVSQWPYTEGYCGSELVSSDAAGDDEVHLADGG